MKEFCILPCSNCKRTPTVSKNPEIFDDNRYFLSHCGISVNGATETQCIVNWNKLQKDGEEDEE